MKYLGAALVSFSLLPLSCIAEPISTLGSNETFVIEISKKISLGWGDKKTWSDYATQDLRWSRGADKSEVFSNPSTGNGIYVDAGTFHNYQLRNGDAKYGETVALESTRNNQQLNPGATWKAEHTYKTYSASWCSDDKARLESKFEVGAPEPYTLIVYGKEVVLEVIPVTETGWWNRCYSGKRYTRHLFSRDLDAIVSIEHIGYTPQGQVHDSSYRINVKEIKKP